MSKTISTAMPISKVNGITINGSLKCNNGNFDNCSKREISYIVMHYTGNKQDAAKGNANYFHNTVCETSAHYFVDDTTIYQSVDLCDIAWHAGDYPMNKKSVGVEMCCTAGNYKIGKKAIENSVALVVELCKLLGITVDKVDTYVIRHYDVIGKKCPAQMAGENNTEWIAFKKSVRDKLAAPIPTTTKVSTFKAELKVLRYGDTGRQVRNAMLILKDRGYYKGDIDNVFGPKMLEAVKAFQKAKGSTKCDGIIGEWTAKMMNK